MSPTEIAQVVSLCRAMAGLKVAPDKTYLMESRLAPVARREGYESIADLLAAVRARRDDPLVWAVVEAMAAGESAFFRDRAPFKEFCDEIVPQLVRARGGGPIRVWSAACGAGQEIYSLAMLLGELTEADPDLRIELAASDLSRLALERAQSGLYNQFDVQRGLPIRRLAQHFEKEGDQWRLAAEVRKRVKWRRINLIAGLRQIGRFDVVFCRYVLCGMTEDAQRKVIDDLACIVPDDGYLVLGLKEAAAPMGQAFQPVVGRPGLYRRNPTLTAAAA
ncbi:MAG TPA: protein-glutamate O-methyltransferase CheR [Caulobacteraceae bacterium]|nr:protein-glutamate O-methyltransferase CheR [Caulobacteraceae bacterium]